MESPYKIENRNALKNRRDLSCDELDKWACCGKQCPLVAGLALAVGDGWWNVQQLFDSWSKAFNSNILKNKDRNDVTHDMTDMINDRNNDTKIMTNNWSDTTSGDIMRCGC